MVILEKSEVLSQADSDSLVHHIQQITVTLSRSSAHSSSQVHTHVTTLLHITSTLAPCDLYDPSVSSYSSLWFGPGTSVTCSVSLTQSHLSGHQLLPESELGAGGAFTYRGPDLWNQLPADLRSVTATLLFKIRLETFESPEAYTSYCSCCSHCLQAF